MTQRILHSLKTFVLAAALRAGIRDAREEAVSPEPVIRHLDSVNDIDEWMFDIDGRPVTELASMYSRETARVSAALTGLRSVLTQIAAHAPIIEQHNVNVSFGPLESDAMLFDGEPMPVHFGILADDADLFEDMPGLRPASIDVHEISRVA